jgi:HK97 family phage major capsid protein
MGVIDDKLAQAQQLYDGVKVILSNTAATPEEKAKVEPMMKDAERFKADAVALKAIMVAATEMDAIKAAAQAEPETKEQRAVKAADKWADWGEFLQKSWQTMCKGSQRDPRLVWFDDDGKGQLQTKNLAENVGSTGGFLVPTEFDATLRALIGERSIVRQRATVIPMRRRQVNLPVLDQTGSTAGLPNWFGGMQVYYTEEGASKPEVNAKFRQISLVAKKLTAWTAASNELLDDSAVSLSAFLAGPMGFAGAVQWWEDYMFLRGTGAGQPLGVINAGATINVNPAAGDVTYTDLVNMIEHFLPTGNPVWVIHQSNMSNLMLMTGPAGQPSYLWGSAADGVPNRLLGYPVIFTEKLPRNKLAGTVLLADFSYYLVGDRQATTVDSNATGERWRYDETEWRVIHRHDGQPWLSAPLTLVDGTSSVSPFVILGAKTT